MEQEDSIQLHLSRGKIFVWNSSGSLPRAPRQNIQLGLPLELMQEEAFALITYGVGKLMRLNLPCQTQGDIATFQNARKESFEKQKVLYSKQVKANEKLYRDSNHVQESKRKKKREKMKKKYEKEKNGQGADTASDKTFGRQEVEPCDLHATSSMENVADRKCFPVTEKSSSMMVMSYEWTDDSSLSGREAGNSSDQMKIDKDTFKEVAGMCEELHPNKSVSLVKICSDVEDTAGEYNVNTIERPDSCDNTTSSAIAGLTTSQRVTSAIADLPASQRVTGAKQLPLITKDAGISDTSPADYNLTSICSPIGMSTDDLVKLPSSSVSTSSNANIPPADLRLINYRHNERSGDPSHDPHLNKNTKFKAYQSSKEEMTACSLLSAKQETSLHRVTELALAASPMVTDKRRESLKAKHIHADAVSSKAMTGGSMQDQPTDEVGVSSPTLIKNQETSPYPKETNQPLSPRDIQDATISDNGCLVQLFTETVNPDMMEVTNWAFPSTDQERIRAAVFLHFWEQGYYLTSGMKFGGDFLVYKGDPLMYHSTFIAVCLPYQKSMSTHMIISYGRLGPIVKKTVVLCSLDDQGDVRCVSLQWSGM